MMIVNEINSFRGKCYFLSNFYEAKVTHDGITYLNNEAAFQACKLKNPSERISFSNLDPSSAKKRGRSVRIRGDWENVKETIMYEVCLAKFTQNEDLKRKLIETGDSILIEGNTWYDTYWGVCNGKGKNALGKILMRIRSELRG